MAKKKGGASGGNEVLLLGADRLQHGLRKGVALTPELLVAAQTRSASQVLGPARSLAPRRTGRLQGSLVANEPSPGAISSFLPYAAPRHWGWREKGMDESLFVLRAGRQTEPKWLRNYKKASDAMLAPAAGGP